MLLAMWIYDGTFASTKKRYMSEQSKNLKKYIIPAMLANVELLHFDHYRRHVCR